MFYAPCCVGKLKYFQKHNETNGIQQDDPFAISIPRSQKFGSVLNLEEYLDLARFADFSEWDFISDIAKAKRLCKSFVELDRNMAATERNYISFLLAMNPCWTPKNDVIFGYPI